MPEQTKLAVLVQRLAYCGVEIAEERSAEVLRGLSFDVEEAVKAILHVQAAEDRWLLAIGKPAGIGAS